MINSTKFSFDKVLKNVEQTKRELPIKIANAAQNFFNEEFKNQEWDGKPWQEVQRRIPGTGAYKYPKISKLGRRTSNILVLSGRLRRDVSTSKKIVSWDKIVFKVVTPYAGYQNYGTNKIPQRKFMGNSQKLTKLLREKINENIKRIWQV